MANLVTIKISPSSSTTIKSWSGGEVTSSETINYRTLKPVPGGLFCTTIFGPLVRTICHCLSRVHSKLLMPHCLSCGGNLSTLNPRRSKMGYIKLTTPLTHIWYLKSNPYVYSLILNIKPSLINQIIYCHSFIITSSTITSKKKGTLLSEPDYITTTIEYGNAVTIKTGGDAIYTLLKEIDIPTQIKVTLSFIITKHKGSYKPIKVLKRLRLLTIFTDNKVKPNWLVIKYLPILPPGLRPLVLLENGQYISSDLNLLYQNIIDRNNRLSRLTSITAPYFIIRESKKILQVSVDILLGGTFDPTLFPNSKRQPKSLSDFLKGKEGRFRQNLLGKRVDFSARSVIVVEPLIPITHCGLPISVALELFKPFILRELTKNHINITSSLLNHIPFSTSTVIRKILTTLVSTSPILLNRAPTLHRMNIQSFIPYLVPNNAIHINPLICKPFNADFDGDQMAIHLPLSKNAIIESHNLLSVKSNLISPANGSLIIIPSNEAILGLYFLTKTIPYTNTTPPYFTSIPESLLNPNHNVHTVIYLKVYPGTFIKTTIGRATFFSILPFKGYLIKHNHTINKQRLQTILTNIYHKLKNHTHLITLINKINHLGLKHVTNLGYSLSLTDFKYKIKTTLLPSLISKIKSIHKEFKKTHLTLTTLSLLTNHLWSIYFKQCSIHLLNSFLTNIIINSKNYTIHNDTNFLFPITYSGSKNILTQIIQLLTSRGLVSISTKYYRPLTYPIISSLFKGLSMFEYFLSSYGSRKGLTDTAIKTASSGYFTRRLVNISQDIIINNTNCGTSSGIRYYPQSIQLSSLIGRYTITPIYSHTGVLIINRNTLLTPSSISLLINTSYIDIRTPSLCCLKRGICSYCYGNFVLSHQKVPLGTPVGVIAAQSIGEPGTQLTMRTFHTGGFTSVRTTTTIKHYSITGFTIFTSQTRYITTQNKTLISSKGAMLLLTITGSLSSKINLTKGTTILFTSSNTPLLIRFTIKHPKPIKSITLGSINHTLRYHQLSNTYAKYITPIQNLYTIKTNSFIQYTYLYSKYSTRIKKAILKDGAIIQLKNSVISLLTIIPTINLNITDNLALLSNLFENITNKPLSTPILTTGYATQYNDKVIIKTKTIPHSNNIRYKLTTGTTYFTLHSLSLKGYPLTNGTLPLQSILSTNGISLFITYFIKKVNQLYSPFNITINSKHIEVLLHSLLRLIIIKTDKFSKTFSVFKLRSRYYKILNIKSFNPSNLLYNNLLLGISRASLLPLSFINVASFKHTLRILAQSSVYNLSDPLLGVKENIIIGKLPPIGTGFQLPNANF